MAMRLIRLLSIVALCVLLFGPSASAAESVPMPIAVAERTYIKYATADGSASVIVNWAYVFDAPLKARAYYSSLVATISVSTPDTNATRQSVPEINEASAGFVLQWLTNSPPTDEGAAVIVLDHSFVFALAFIDAAKTGAEDLATATELAQQSFSEPRQPVRNDQGNSIAFAADLIGGPSIAPLDLLLRFEEVPAGYQLLQEDVRVPMLQVTVSPSSTEPEPTATR